MTQLFTLVVVVCALLMVSLLVWFRRPAGRGTSGPSRPDIKDIGDFDDANPSAPSEVRLIFIQGYTAHINDNFGSALIHYNQVLGSLPNDWVTQHNITEIGRWSEDK